MTRALMFMGTGSDVGKSLIVAGLCRAFADRGLAVAPFKPQNMSNNAAVTADGGEIGRAQALQARAARREALTAMNPVLLKPEAESGAQLVLRGRRIGSFSARDYWAKRGALLPRVVESFHELDADLVLVEGAGSASEINLRGTDIANFGFARAANVPVVVIGDIDRGGVIAALVGTFAVIDPADAALIRATLVNRFRGDPSLFAEGPGAGGPLLVAVPRLPRIANFDDLDPLRAEPDIDVVIVEPGRPLPQAADLIVLPGSKATRADLAALRQAGWDIDILAHRRAGKKVLGLCGGYQMLGRVIRDPLGIEGAPGESAGLGLLDVETVLTETKQLRVEHGVHCGTGLPLGGYHMHLGETAGPDTARPFARIDGVAEGAISPDGVVIGTYMHGIFADDAFRHAFMNAGSTSYEAGVEAALDGLAAHLAAHLDLERLLAMAAGVSR
jgi:adenosylcobyric acid synthase